MHIKAVPSPQNNCVKEVEVFAPVLRHYFFFLLGSSSSSLTQTVWRDEAQRVQSPRGLAFQDSRMLRHLPFLEGRESRQTLSIRLRLRNHQELSFTMALNIKILIHFPLRNKKSSGCFCDFPQISTVVGKEATGNLLCPWHTHIKPWTMVYCVMNNTWAVASHCAVLWSFPQNTVSCHPARKD